jgi:hypothetical protein
MNMIVVKFACFSNSMFVISLLRSIAQCFGIEGNASFLYHGSIKDGESLNYVTVGLPRLFISPTRYIIQISVT